MHLNEFIKLLGNKVLLVPYKTQHVPKYHEWMNNETLRNLTDSEKLSLSEEYELQKSLRINNDMLTFIVLCAETYAKTNDEIAAMIGETHILLRYDEDIEKLVAVAKVMIAEPEARGKGYGREALLLLLKFAETQLMISIYEVKIDMDNVKSIRLFESFQFVETRREEALNKVILQRDLTDDWLAWLVAQVQPKAEPYVGA